MPKLIPTCSVKQKRDLIQAVRAEKSLYDPKTAKLKPKYGVWGQVAARSGLKRGLVAKLMWKHIHEAYVAFRKNPDSNRNEANSVLFEHMKFLDVFLEPHVTTTTDHSPPVPSCKENENNKIKKEENEEVGEVQSSNLNEATMNINETTTSGEFATIQYWNDTADNSTNLKELQKNATLHQTTQACSEFSSGSDLESYEDIILPDAITNGTSDNSLKMFFDAMFASTSQMPQACQRTVKSKIFAAVLEAEEQAEKLRSSAIGTS